MKKTLVLLLVAIPVILYGIWFAFTKESLQSLIEWAFAGGDGIVEIKGLEKGIFYDFSISRATLKTSRSELISFENIRARINPLYLLIMRMDISFKGDACGGNFSGCLHLRKKRAMGEIEIKRAVIDEVPFLKLAGIKGAGTVSGKYLLADGNGHADFFTQDAVFEPAFFSGIKMPLNLFSSIKGSLDIKGDIINIVSVSLEGKDVYARLKGSVRNAFIDIKMELMPGPPLAENPLFLAEFERNKVSPGYYVIAVREQLSL